jgi:hypothetical protein
VLRQVIGRCVVVGVVASGIGAAAASPSSAMPRDVCMDEVNYWEQHSWLQQMQIDTFDISVAWGAAVHEVNPVSGESWTANLPSGYETVFTQADYIARFATAYNNADHAQYALDAFEANNAPC